MSQIFGTKAETLALLRARGFLIPQLFFFEAQQWQQDPDAILNTILHRFSGQSLAIRSSAQCEDSSTTSMAGAFLSILHVPCEIESLRDALTKVIKMLFEPEDQVLVQPMLENVQIAGVIMTRVLDDGSPYYVFNYDDISGRTDTVTGGEAATKLVYVYKGVSENDFDSPRLRGALALARSLEAFFHENALDIEFAVDSEGHVWLLQVRPICTSKHWKKHGVTVSKRILFVENFVRTNMRRRPGFFGRRTMYGVMPDWNPAEIIGLVPRPLAFSLYREIITKNIWSEARALMGYKKLPPADLMVSVAGRPYIDIRASFNSFLPANLPDSIAEKCLNAWLDRLEAHPELHDKVEFEIVPTVLTFDTETMFNTYYQGLLDSEEKHNYIIALRELTNTALCSNGTLEWAMQTVEHLYAMPLPPLIGEHDDLTMLLPALLEDCRRYGTLPFAVAARHAFMAESLLRSAVHCGALSEDRLHAFKRSFSTISGQLSAEFAIACHYRSKRTAFLEKYGHLRPGTYDILSPSYAQRINLFDAKMQCDTNALQPVPFTLKQEEHDCLARLLASTGLTVKPSELLDYARKAIAGREYAKFVFTRHLSHILELMAIWGKSLKLSRAQVSMIPVEELLFSLFAPLPNDARKHFLGIVRKQLQLYGIASSFKLSQLLRSPRDVYIAAVHRAAPNFISSKRIEAPVVHLSAEEERNDLGGALVCIESADPGYDWVFTRGIAGLITRFGGANSHMAIRCAEYGLPAAIGCGTLLFEKVSKAHYCLLDCGDKTLRPIEESMQL